MLKAGLTVIVWGVIAYATVMTLAVIAIVVMEPSPQERREAKVAQERQQNRAGR